MKKNDLFKNTNLSFNVTDFPLVSIPQSAFDLSLWDICTGNFGLCIL